MNKQNSFISAQIKRSAAAVEGLIKSGATVLGVQLEQPKPRIEIQTPKAANIGEILVVRGTQQGVREQIKFSTFSGCTVFWKA